MNISRAAALSGLPAKTIRYYEEIGLAAPAGRAGNGYRDYGQDDVHRLCFLRRARGLGFTVAECRELLALYQDRTRASAEVKAIALGRIEDIERKIAELAALKAALSELAAKCHGDARPHCPILEGLAGDE
jgi:Cu(I)-responsive transcriptional regulator